MLFPQEAVTVGPSSVAYKLMTEALVFGGKIITSTDIAVAFGLCEIGDKERTKDIPEVIKDGAMAEIKKKIEAAIDLVKVSYKCRLIHVIIQSCTGSH